MKKIKYFTVPNIFTLGNLTCGAVAVMLAFGSMDIRTAFWLIVAGAILDFFDGFVARLLKQYSAIGKQLDSLADMVTFGIAPAAIIYLTMRQAAGADGWEYYLPWLAFAIPICSALRLAKFNIDESQGDSFVGLPTPANAIFFASIGYLSTSGIDFGIYGLAAATVIMSWLMISPVRMFALKFKGFGWHGNGLRYVFMLLSAAALAVLRIEALPLIIGAYILVSVVTHFTCKK